MARLLSKRIGNTIIRGEIVPQYAQALSASLNKALISRGIETTPSKFDGTFKVGNDNLDLQEETVDKGSMDRFLDHIEKIKSIKTRKCVAATEELDS